MSLLITMNFKDLLSKDDLTALKSIAKKDNKPAAAHGDKPEQENNLPSAQKVQKTVKNFNSKH